MSENYDDNKMIAAVQAWQSCGVRPLTCRHSGHQLLVPVVMASGVGLRCLDCGYEQSYIPPIVLQAYESGASTNPVMR